MASRTQIVCLCEGTKGASIDEVFINKLIRTIKPSWLRRDGANYVRMEARGGRKEVIAEMPNQLRLCVNAGGDTTLDEFDGSEPTVVVVGSEGKGLSRLVRETCDAIIGIPMAGPVESLNASVAAGVVLAEIARQRRV